LGCAMLRIPHCLDNRLIDGRKVVSLTHPPHFTPQKHYYFNANNNNVLFRQVLKINMRGTLQPSSNNIMINTCQIRYVLISEEKRMKNDLLFRTLSEILLRRQFSYLTLQIGHGPERVA
jgi:hypothetical protein